MGFFMRGGLGLTAFFAFSLWLYGCSGNGLGGTPVCGTEIEDPYQLAGCVEKDGGDIAMGVRVSAIPKNGGIAKGASEDTTGTGNIVPAAVVISDEKGLYKFKGLEKGEYTLYFDYLDTANPADVQAHRLDGAYALSKGVNPLGASRLKPASTLIVKAMNSMEIEAVPEASCHIDNTPYAGTTGKTGFLILYAVPGKYFIQCEKGPLKSQPYEVNLESGETAQYDVPMFEGGQVVATPPPSNVAAEYDTTSGLVRVSWTRPAAPGAFIYRVRRVEIEKIDFLVGSENVPDLFYNDPVFAEDGDTVTSKTVQYNVASKRGASYGSAVSNVVSSKPLLVTRGPTVKTEFLDPNRKSCVAGDTALVLGTYKSRLFHNIRVVWTARNGVDILKDVAVDNRSGADTLAFPCTVPGDPSLVLRVTDEAGITAIGVPLKFEIIPTP